MSQIVKGIVYLISSDPPFMEWHVLFTKKHLIYGMVCFIHKDTPNLWNVMFYSQM